MNIYLKLIEIVQETIPSLEARLDAIEDELFASVDSAEDIGGSAEAFSTRQPIIRRDSSDVDESEVSRDIGGGSEEDVATGIIGRGLRTIRAVVDGSNPE